MIYVITHKDFQHGFLDKENYAILHVGKTCTSEKFICDNTGDNISHKNENYCELTGLYWIWKNSAGENEIVGLVHYRRFFTTKICDLMYTYLGVAPRLLSIDRIKRTLSKYDIIVPTRERIHRTVRQYYNDLHVIEDMDVTRNVIEELFPEYIPSFDQVMNGHYFYYANMMICRKGLLDEYCSWLFQILFEVEKKINIAKYSDNYQKRVFGFLSERLIQVWIKNNKLRTKEYPVFNIESRRKTVFQKNFSRIKKLLRKRK